MSDSLEARISASLNQDEGLAHLIQSLELADSFQFHLLTCPTPRIAQVAIAIIKTRTQWWKGPATEFQTLDPYADKTFAEGIPPQRLLETILQAMLEAEAPANGFRVVLVDGSKALKADFPAWEALFQRMNERRNTIAKMLTGPLILCLSEALEIAFAHQAPDFWSIRSVCIQLNAPSLPDETRLMTAERLPFFGDLPEPTLSAQPVDLAQARTRLADHPEDVSALRALSIALDNKAEQEEQRGKLEAALTYYEESLALARGLLKRDPDRVDWRRDLSISLNNVGRIHEQRGDLAQALACYEESLVLRRELLQRNPDRLEWLRDLSVNLEYIGHIHHRRGDFELALGSYEESLAHRRELIQRDPEQVEWRRDLSINLNLVGRIHEQRGNLEPAMGFYEESLSLLRGLLQREPNRAERQRDLSVGLEDVGRIHQQRGDLAQALACHEESLALRRELLQRDPDRVEWRRDLSVSLNHVGRIHRERGDLAQALIFYEEFLLLARGLVQRDPERVEWLRDLSVSLNNIGLTYLQRGELQSALAAFQECQQTLQKLPGWMQKQEAEQIKQIRQRCEALQAQLDAAEPVLPDASKDSAGLPLS